MKIAVISDSHYNENSIALIKQYLKDVDVLLHCGDGAPDIKHIETYFNGEIYAVRGNCDITLEYPLERVIEIMGKRIFITHGHMYNVKNEYNTIFYKGKEVDANIVLFGHTHKAIITSYDNLNIMNPGSISLPYGRDKRTIGFIELLEDKNIEMYLKEI